MPSRREITDQSTEIKRLTEALRNLREARTLTADTDQIKQITASIGAFRERLVVANEALAESIRQYQSLGALGRALADFRAATLGGKAAMAAGAGAGGLAAAGAAPGQAIGALAMAAQRVVGVFDRLGSSMVRFVEASNPGEMLRFKIAVADLSAAFGRVFEPVINVATEFANVLNQFITSLQPVLGPVVRQLADAFLQIAKAVLDAVAPIVESLMPILQLLADVVLPPIVTVFRVLADAIRAVINWVRSWLGLSPLEAASTRGGARTASAQRASLIGTEQIGEQARAAAFGAASTLQAMQRNNSLTESSNELLRDIGRAIDRMAAGQGGVAAVADASIAAINGMAGRRAR